MFNKIFMILFEQVKAISSCSLPYSLIIICCDYQKDGSGTVIVVRPTFYVVFFVANCFGNALSVKNYWCCSSLIMFFYFEFSAINFMDIPHNAINSF